MDSPDKLIVFDNSFFISEITNYAEKKHFIQKQMNIVEKSFDKKLLFQ